MGERGKLPGTAGQRNWGIPFQTSPGLEVWNTPIKSACMGGSYDWKRLEALEVPTLPAHSIIHFQQKTPYHLLSSTLPVLLDGGKASLDNFLYNFDSLS